jgi:hypothetical protein
VTDRLILEEDVDEALERARKDFGWTRQDAVRAILRDWLIGHQYLRVHILDEDSKTEGTA